MPSPGPHRDLASIIKGRGALTVGEALRACAAAARALQQAAQRSESHGDVQPSLIEISDLGEVSLTGFGTNLAGTADYLAPERFQGKPADGPSDVYALGCTMFYLVAGRPPFRRLGEKLDAQVLAKRHREEPPIDLTDHVSGTDPAVAALCNKMMSKDPAARPSYDVILATLAHLLAQLSAASPKLEAPSSLGGRTAFLAAIGSTENDVPDQLPALRAIKWGIAILIFVGAVVWLWSALP